METFYRVYLIGIIACTLILYHVTKKAYKRHRALEAALAFLCGLFWPLVLLFTCYIIFFENPPL